jgi:hypothetical protein
MQRITSREILLGASLSSDYGLGGSRGGWERDLSNDGEYSASESRGQKFHRHPDLGPNWQKDLDLIGYCVCEEKTELECLLKVLS